MKDLKRMTFFYFSTFYGLIIGRNRENLKNLEYQTKTRIKIPGLREKSIISRYIYLKLYNINYKVRNM